MAEHAVKYYGNTLAFCFFTKRLQVLFRTEQGVDFAVIGGVVTVVTLRLEYGIEINAGGTQTLDIVKLLFYTLKVTLKIVVVEYLAVPRRSPLRLTRDITSELSAVGNILFLFA